MGLTVTTLIIVNIVKEDNNNIKLKKIISITVLARDK